MENTGYIALSRQLVLRQQMNVVANNLANMNTSGFKGERMLFSEYLNKTEDGKLLSFVQDLAVYRDLQQGPMTRSGNPLDLAISGEGYFKVETPGGERYTRRGSFTLDERGRIVTPEGHPVLTAGDAPITIPTDSNTISITRDGTVSTEDGEVGRLQVVGFEREQYLTRTENGLYDAGEEQPEAVQEPDIQQGMIERSNVQGVVEMTRLIETVRSYQSASKMTENEHERQRKAIDKLVSA